MVRPGWPRQPITARSSPQIRRFPHLINADKVFGTHTADIKKIPGAAASTLFPRSQSYRTVFAAVAASTMTDLLTVPSRAFSIQQTRGQRGAQVWSQGNRAPPRGRAGRR